MRKTTLFLAFIVVAMNVNAQLFGNLLGGGGGGGNKGTAKDKLTDPPQDAFGYSGIFYTNKGYRVKFVFTQMENGTTVNKMAIYHKNDNTKLISDDLKLDEKSKEKFKLLRFNYSENSLIQIAPDMFALVTFTSESYRDDASKIEQIVFVAAKDEAKAKEIDDVTAKTLVEGELFKLQKEKADEEFKKLMENETFAKMVGKIGFIKRYSDVCYNCGRGKITEKTDVFVNSIELGKDNLYYRAYFKANPKILCPGCEMNTIYEIDGVKTSRVELRRSSAKWSNNIKKREIEDGFHTAAPTLISLSENIVDYAFLYCIYQNKAKFKDGANVKMKVTITTNQDGVDKDVVAEGTITLVYKDANKEGFKQLMDWVDELLNE
jgi:Zn finger protein HypA/HybF involved in hydrogenase expression